MGTNTSSFLGRERSQEKGQQPGLLICGIVPAGDEAWSPPLCPPALWPDFTDGACHRDPLWLGRRSSCPAESRRCQPCHTPSHLVPWLSDCYWLTWGQTSVHTGRKTRKQVRVESVSFKTSFSLEDFLDSWDECCCLKTPNFRFSFQWCLTSDTNWQDRPM